MSFGDVKQPIYGSYGEFNIQNGSSSLRVNYVQSKIRPGSSGWESNLASMMVPWRELFNLEEMSFDELLQRDLDDSRVAHDLIPYLIGDEGHKAKFFPPILAVMVPMKSDKSGIDKYYPEISENGKKIVGGDLFEFSAIEIDDQVSPLGKLDYDGQNTSFVIVDGQHRAMAVLALHRQLNKSWHGNRYESYYNHIEITPDQIGQVELPVCILYFPDLHKNNSEVIDKGVDLRIICRDIFLVVNKHAKKVSSTRELLLDDDDFCARMMRSTLSKLKSRGDDESGLSRIYSFSYGDDDDDGKVLKGQEYSTASFIHKFHAAISFGQANSLNLIETSEVTDGRRVQNSLRPPQLLRDTDYKTLNSLSRFSAKSHLPEDTSNLVELLGNLVDIPVLCLYDKFKPFNAYNSALRTRRYELSQPEMKAQAIQAKSYALMFEGAGSRNVFIDHKDRLEGLKDECDDKGQDVPAYINEQLNFTNSVLTAFDDSLSLVNEMFICQLFNLDKDKIQQADNQSYIDAVKKGRNIFSAFQTQAFQMGYMMMVHTLLHRIAPKNSSYTVRLDYLSNISDVVIQTLNTFYSENGSKHKSISGLITRDRIDVFSPSGIGLRGMLKLSGIQELNEKQWTFFRYALLEIIHSKYCKESLLQNISSLGNAFEKQWKDGIKNILYDVEILRKKYIDKSVDRALHSQDFDMEKVQLQANLNAEGKDDTEIEKEINKLETTKKNEILALINAHLKASLGKNTKDIFSYVYSE